MRNIVVGVHGTTEIESALDFALEEAVRRRLPLRVLHSYALPVYGEIPPALFPDRLRQVREDAERLAAVALDQARDRTPGGLTVSAHLSVMESDPASALLAASESAALLVVGCRGANAVLRGLLGSVSAACLHASRAPVAVVPNIGKVVHDTSLERRIVVGLDGSPASVTALSWATAQAREWGCALAPVVVSSGDRLPPAMRSPGSSNDVMANVLRLVGEAGGSDLEVHPLFLVGNAAQQLLATARPADLVVVGSRGHGALASLLLGSTSLSVAERAECPVVVVRTGQARREIHQRAGHAYGL